MVGVIPVSSTMPDVVSINTLGFYAIMSLSLITFKTIVLVECITFLTNFLKYFLNFICLFTIKIAEIGGDVCKCDDMILS